jgi:Flp pilus assembly protein TadD
MRACAAALAILALAIAVPGAFAEGFESKPEAVARDPDYAAGKKAIESKDWKEAIARLDKAAKRDPDNPDIQNWLGYAHRNLKEYDLAFRHYERAIDLDPRHRGAHEYIGETYLLVGNLAAAQKHLEALRAICLLGCEELTDLQEAIEKYRKGAK